MMEMKQRSLVNTGDGLISPEIAQVMKTAYRLRRKRTVNEIDFDFF